MSPLDECCIPCPDCSYVTCTERDGLCEHRNPVCESCCSTWHWPQVYDVPEAS